MRLIDRVRQQMDGANGQKLAISHRPDLQYRQHWIVQTAAGAMQSELDDYADYASVYKVYSWVRKAIGVIKDNVSPLPVRVVNSDGDPIDNHPLTLLYNYVNDETSSADLWEVWIIHKMLGGEAFFEFVGNQSGSQLLEIWPRRPDMVGVHPDQSDERQLYPRVGGYSFGDDDNMIPPELMLHDKFYNPTNPWRGVAPITALRSAIVIDLFASSWSRTLLQRGARPDYAVIAPEGITPSEREDLETALMEKYGGPENWHRPVLLEKGITDVKPLSFPPKDVEWLEQRKFSRDEVGAIFGIPDEVMGYGRDTYENMDAAHRWLWILTLLPMVERRDAELTKYHSKIRKDLRPGESFATDLSDVTAIQEDLMPKVEMAVKLWSMGAPFNQIDEQLGLGIGPIPGGDVGYLPMALLPAGSTNPALLSPAERQFWPVQDFFMSDAPAVTYRTQIHLPKHKSVEYGSDQHKALIDTFEEQKLKYVSAMKRQLRKEFQEQQNDTLRAFRAISQQELEGLLGDPSLIVGMFFDIRSYIDDMRTSFNEHYENVVGLFGEAAFDDVSKTAKRIGKQDPAEIAIAFDLADPLIADAIMQMQIQFAKDINLTTQSAIIKRLRPILAQAADEGWSISRIQTGIYDNISAVFNVRKSDYETERIARTEMNKGANFGKLEGWRQSGVVKQKTWLAALDGRERDTHRDAHNTYQASPIPLNENFLVGAGAGPAPGQLGVAEEDINCRCTMLAVIS